jgi:hypothetical protein
MLRSEAKAEAAYEQQRDLRFYFSQEPVIVALLALMAIVFFEGHFWMDKKRSNAPPSRQRNQRQRPCWFA